VKLKLICVGKLSERFLREGTDEYSNRLKHYLPFSCLELKEEKAGGKKADARVIRELEGDKILAKISPDAFVVVLDERGAGLTSENLASLLDRHMVQGTSELIAVIGGAYGLSDKVRQRGDLILSLSAMTLTHQMARLFFLEQLYRGFTIIRNEPYHNR
jgi:23S rRNA (pseudouridine1915-N3)-methyltransferase